MRYSFSFCVLMLLFVTVGCNSVDSDVKNTDEDESAVEGQSITNDTIIQGGAIKAEPTHADSKPEPSEESVQTQTENETVPSGEQNYFRGGSGSNKSNIDNSFNNDPFSSGGGNGDSGGSVYVGPGTGPGPGDVIVPSGVDRKRITNVNTATIESTENATISLILTIDAQGNVIKAYCNTAGSTTTNQILINRVISAVKRDVKYTKDPGSILVKVKLEVNISPS